MIEFVHASPSERGFEVFNARLDLPAAERIAYFDFICANHVALRPWLDKFAEANEDMGIFLETPAKVSKQPGDAVRNKRPLKFGGRNGRYKLRQQIGQPWQYPYWQSRRPRRRADDFGILSAISVKKSTKT